MTSLFEQIFDSRQNIKRLKLQLHPDKGGDAEIFIKFNQILKKLNSFYSDWATRIISSEDIQYILTNQLSKIEEKRKQIILQHKLTLQHIIDYVHEQFNQIELRLAFNLNYLPFTIMRYTKNERHSFQTFTLFELKECLSLIVLDLSNMKKCLQKSKPFIQHNYIETSSNTILDLCLDKNFDWKSLLSIDQHQSISAWFLTFDDVTEFDYVAQKTIGKNIFQDFLFQQITNIKPTRTKRKYERKNSSQTKKRKKTKINKKTSNSRINIHVCDNHCNPKMDKSDKLRKIVLENLTPAESVIIQLCINWLNENSWEWVERSEVINHVSSNNRQKKNVATDLTNIYQKRSSFCCVNERTLGFLMRKKKSKVEIRYNIK